MKKILIIILSLSWLGVDAQMDPLYAQYLNNPLLINPGYTGLSNNFNASITYRKQWAGFDGNPTTINACGHLSLVSNKMGLGTIILQDKIGNNKNMEAHLTYSYKLFLNKTTISFGLQAGMINFRSDNGDLNPYDQNDPTFNHNINLSKPSFGAGILFKQDDRFLLGLSMPRMLRTHATFEGIQTDLYSQHFYATAAYAIFLSERSRLKPAVLLKSVKGAPLSVDYNLSFTIDEKYLGGVYTRNLTTYGALMQIKLGDVYRLGYVMEIPSKQSVGTRFTTHELTIGFNTAIFNFHDTTSPNF